jgi:hypothetical protein
MSIKNLPPDAQQHAWGAAITQSRKIGMELGPEYDDFGMLDVLAAKTGKTGEIIENEYKRRELDAKGASPTAGMKEYQFAMQQRQAQGLPPVSFEEFQKASKGPLVQITGEKAYDKKRGEALADDYGQVQRDGLAGTTRIGQLRQLDELLSNPNVYTGTGAQSINALKRAAQTLFGQDSIEGVADADAARRISTEMALSLKQDLPGPMSTADRDFLQSIPPNISDTAQGRKLLVELMVAKEQRKIEIANLARDYDRRHGRLDDRWYGELARFNAENPVFTPQMMESARAVASQGQQQSPAAGVLPRVTDVKSYNAVPPGSRYIDSENRVRTKGRR